MEEQPLEHVLQLVQKKLKVYRFSPMRFITRSALASMFIGFGVIVAFKTGSFFYSSHSPLTYPMAAITFGAAIILIVYGGGDLFTGNTFYFTYAALNKRVGWKEVIRIWVNSYFGNILGAIAFALLIAATGLFRDNNVNGFLLNVVSYKMNAPAYELFFRAVLCNWLICLAFFIPWHSRAMDQNCLPWCCLCFVFLFRGTNTA